MNTLSTLAAIWIAPHTWHLSATGTDDAAACEIHSDQWRREPAWRKPVALVDWALSIARGNETPPPSTGRKMKFKRPADDDNTLRFSLLISPEACRRFELPAQPADGPHPWHYAFEQAGWNVRTRTTGPWLTIERKGAEIGILMVGWLDPRRPVECAGHGITVNTDTGHIDGWGSVFVHGEYRRMTGWPLSAGAGMAAIKGLWRHNRTTPVTWAPRSGHKTSADYWNTIPPIALGRSQRPWHLHWTTPRRTGLAAANPDASVAVWDANADYLNAWTGARFARDRLVQTGRAPRQDSTTWPAGYYLIDSIEWHPEVRYVVDMLPPIWGSRTPGSDGAVWVTHVIIELLDAMKFAPPDNAPPRYRILDSYTCDDSGQIARSWGDRLKDALITTREERDRNGQDLEMQTLAETLKQSYARGYPLLETSGIIRRPDHVDTLVDQRWQSAYRRMFKTAWDRQRYPLDVAADEITYQWRAGDQDEGPLGQPHPYAYGRYKIKHLGTLAEWDQSHQDGRRGRWWDPTPAGSGAPLQRPPQAAPAPSSGGDWLSDIYGD